MARTRGSVGVAMTRESPLPPVPPIPQRMQKSVKANRQRRIAERRARMQAVRRSVENR